METTYDDFWATGLDKDATIHTVATAWPGDNKLGSFITEIEVHLRRSSGRSQSIPRTKSNRKTKSYQIADLSHLINELKTPRKCNCYGNRKLSPKILVSHPKIGRAIANFLLLSCQFGELIRTYFMDIDYLYVYDFINLQFAFIVNVETEHCIC